MGLVIGAPSEEVSGKTRAGAVYLKVRGQAEMTRLVRPAVIGGSQFGSGLDASGDFLGIRGKRTSSLPAAYVSRSEPSKVHSLATSHGGKPTNVFAVPGVLLVKTSSQIAWFKRQSLMPFTAAAERIFRRYMPRDTARSVQCAKANRDKRLRAYFALWMVKFNGE